MKRLLLIGSLSLLAACGSPSRAVQTVPKTVDIAAWVYRFPDAKICSGSSVVQAFHNLILPNGDMGQENVRPADATSAGHQRDVYRSDPSGILWISSDTLDASGNLTAQQQSVTLAFPLPLTIADGATISLSGHGTYQWGQCANGVCNWTYRSGYAATRTFTLSGGVLTSHETYLDDDPMKDDPFDLTITYDSSGLRSVAGLGRCN
jgi:hypothetical protein